MQRQQALLHQQRLHEHEAHQLQLQASQQQQQLSDHHAQQQLMLEHNAQQQQLQVLRQQQQLQQQSDQQQQQVQQLIADRMMLERQLRESRAQVTEAQGQASSSHKVSATTGVNAVQTQGLGYRSKGELGRPALAGQGQAQAAGRGCRSQRYPDTGSGMHGAG